MSRAGSTQSGGWGTRKNSGTIPRGVHAARQKHAPCVGLIRNGHSNTTDIMWQEQKNGQLSH